MRKLDSNLMHAALTALLEPQEQYSFPVYVGFSERYLSSLEQTYGFLAVTTHERLLVSRFSLLTIPMKQQAFALQTLQKLSVRQIPLLKTRKITMQFQSTGKVESLRCFCSPKTFGMGLPNQETQLQQLLETLNLWSIRSDFTE